MEKAQIEALVDKVKAAIDELKKEAENDLQWRTARGMPTERPRGQITSLIYAKFAVAVTIYRWFETPVVATIYLNHEQVNVYQDHLSYDEIVALIPNRRNALYTVVYHKAVFPKAEGLLAPGRTIQIQNGTRINAVVTDNA
jgi:hypothetical protein